MTKSKKNTKNKTRGKVSAATKFLVVINLLFIVLLFTTYLSLYISPAKFWPIAFAGLAYPLILVCNIFFILFWLVFLKKYFVLSLFAVLIGYNQFKSYFKFTGSESSLFQENSIKVMSYNVRLFDLYNWRNETGKSTRAAIFDLINTESSDVLCLQEFYSGAGQNLDFSDSIASKTGYKYKSVELINKDSKGLPFGQAIFSKYPIIKNQKISFSNSMVNFGQISDIKIGKDTIRVINLHFESIKFGKEDYNFVSEVTSTPPPNDQIKKVSKQIIQKMKNAYIRRSVQAETVSRFVESSPYPVVLCGDFNDTPVSYSYRLIDKNLDDAFVNKGKGLGQTHAQMLPLLRLDYIFHSKSMQTLEYKTIDKDYSDHFPVVARLLLPQ